ncbi:MAG: helix-turn-helix transcriptional regulator [Rhodoferax sp.]
MNPVRQSIGGALRSARLAKSLSQQALAAAVGISRTTLIQIEKGKDAQMSNVEMTAQALGVKFGILSESVEMARRRQARSEHQIKLAASREKHLKIAVQFALGGTQAAQLKTDALRMVQLWKDKQLCSPVYIERWEEILDAKPAQIAQSLLTMEDDAWGPALRQNTPFAVSLP